MPDRIDVGEEVPALLRDSALVTDVRLTGSRADGRAGPFSDWDFAVVTADFDALAAELPALLRPLDPLVAQWDRLGVRPTYMLLLPGPVKVDVIFEDQRQDESPPWEVTAGTLQGIDDHAWDWLLWMAAKVDAGRHDLVADELARFAEHVLRPMGGAGGAATVGGAARTYLAARSACEERLGVRVDRRAGHEVQPVLDAVETGSDREGTSP